MPITHDRIMRQSHPRFQNEIRLPYSDWPTTEDLTVSGAAIAIDCWSRHHLTGVVLPLDREPRLELLERRECHSIVHSLGE